jgi:hypothetical protein
MVTYNAELYSLCNVVIYRVTQIYYEADRKVRFPYLLKINSNIYFQNQIHNMKS